MAKWVERGRHDADRLPEYVARAFHTALQGRPGPVVLVLPEDMLTQPTAAPVLPRVVPAQAWPAPGALREVRSMLLQARRPIVIAGGSGWDAESCARPAAFCRELAAAGGQCVPLPGLASTTTTRYYAGDVGIGINPRLAASASEPGRPGHRPRPAPGRDDHRRLHADRRAMCPKQKLVHIHASAEELEQRLPARSGDLRPP
jgi:acetolactate synthase-1/2/3 large subunit